MTGARYSAAACSARSDWFHPHSPFPRAVHAAAQASPTFTFKNPIAGRVDGSDEAPDPWVTYRGGWYYYVRSAADGIRVYKARAIQDIGSAPYKASIVVSCALYPTWMSLHARTARSVHERNGAWALCNSMGWDCQAVLRLTREDPSQVCKVGQHSVHQHLFNHQPRITNDGVNEEACRCRLSTGRGRIRATQQTMYLGHRSCTTSAGGGTSTPPATATA